MSATARPATTAAGAIEVLPFPVCVYDPAGRLAFANAAAATRLPEIEGMLAAAGGLGRTPPWRWRGAQADGGSCEISAVALPEGGTCIVLLDTDIGGIAARVRQLETVLAHLGGGVALFDPAQQLLLSNPRFEALIGVPPGSLAPGTTRAEMLRLLATGGEITAAEAAAAEARDTSRPYRKQRIRPDGSVLQVDSNPLPEAEQLLEITDITTLRQAEAEAEARAALLDGVLAALPQGVLVFDRDQRVCMINESYRAIMAGAPVAIGDHRAAIARRRAEAGEYGPPGDDPERLARENLATLGEATARRRRVRPNGTAIDIRYAALPDGGFVQVTTDITELHRAETQARERAALLQLMLDNMRHGIALFDRDGRLITGNALAARLCGLTAEQVTPGRTIDELVADQVAAGEFLPEVMTEALRLPPGRGLPASYRRVRPDGTVLEVVADPTPDGGFVVTYSDVTARARAEAEARDRAALLQATIDHLRQGIIVYGPDRRVRLTNRLAGELAGHPPGMVAPGRTLDEIVRGMVSSGALDPGEDSEAIIARGITADRSTPSTVIRNARGGRVIEIHSDPLPDGGFIVSHLDITALAQAEAEARQRAAMLQAMLDNMRHGIALFGPDGRLRLANVLAASLSGLMPADFRPGVSVEAVIERQHALGVFGRDEKAAALVARLKQLDRSRHQGGIRTLPDGRVVDVESYPAPDGGFVVTWSDITARAEAEEAARRRAGQLRDSLDSLAHGVVLYGPDRRLVVANRLAAKSFGVPDLDERVGELFESLVDGQRENGVFGTGETAERDYQRVIGLDRRIPHTYQRRMPDGRIYEVRSQPTPEGGFVISHSDVTDLLQAQGEAADRARLLQVMLDNIRHGIIYYGPDRRLIAANALVAELGGHPPEALRPGRTVDALIEEQIARGGLTDDLVPFVRAMDRSKPHRYVRPRAGGGLIEVTSDPTPDGGFVVTLSDITALAEAEAEAKRRAGVQQVMLDTIRHGIMLLDGEDRVVAANRMFREMLDLPADLVAPGRHFSDFVTWLEAHGEYAEGEAEAIRNRDRRASIRAVRRRPNGTIMEVVSDPTPDGGWVLTFTDITVPRRAQEEIERARDAAEAANRAKSRFLATMSHELRTPLNAVIGFSEALMSMPPNTTEPDYLRAIHDAGRHLLSLIDDILDVTRAETGGFQTGEAIVDAARVAEEAVRLMEPTAATAQVALRLAVEPGLPRLQADELRLRQVLLNLLSNAVKFSAPGAVVTLAAARDAQHGGVRIRVVDSGIGMPPEDIPRAFEPFTQLDNALSRRFHGSGLGLYLARALAMAQGATLSLTSAPGTGTTAELHFPTDRLEG